MKPNLSSLCLAILTILPTAVFAQGTYLSAPDGNPTNALVVATGGNIGIGSTTPTAKLEIYNPNSGSGDELRIVGDREAEIVLASTTDPDWNSGPLNAYWHLAAHGVDDGGFRILRWANGGYQHHSTFTITRDGNFGVGTLYPQAKLDVSGKINCTVLELTSDRNQKQDFTAVDARRVLDRLMGLPIMTWAYTNNAQVRHIGPMAQDWKAAYPELGSDEKHIGAGDLGGVALAAIQNLNVKLTESLNARDAEIAALKHELSALRGDNAKVAARFEKLEKVIAQAVLPMQPSASVSLTADTQ